MGIDCDMFIQPVPDDFKCPICLDVLEKPIQLTACKHYFCTNCIQLWIERSLDATCPKDRIKIKRGQVKSAKDVTIQIGQMTCRCDFWSAGCRKLVQYQELKAHVQRCTFNHKFSFCRWFKRAASLNNISSQSNEKTSFDLYQDKQRPAYRPVAQRRQTVNAVGDQQSFNYIYLSNLGPTLVPRTHCTLSYRF